MAVAYHSVCKKHVVDLQRMPAARGISSSAASLQQASGDVIGIDLGTTNSCVAIMEVSVQLLRSASEHETPARMSTVSSYCHAGQERARDREL